MDYNIAALFKTLIEQKGSDLHIAANSPPRIRVDGHVAPLNVPPLTPNDAQELCFRVMNESQKKVFEEKMEIDFSFEVTNLARFRANVYYDQGNVAGAFRMIPTKIFTLDELALPKILKDISTKPRGLVLVTGPTGSGKSTTLAAMLDYINTNKYGHILTIEDPIEFIHSHKNCIVNQRELGQDTLSFSKALKSVLRQDPDVVLVGELRDLETIQTALTIAETGHLVLATLHTNSCISTINRIIDVFPAHQQTQIRVQLAMTLEAVLSQILPVAKNGGRVLAMEIMLINTAIRSLISEGKTNQIYSAIQMGQADSHMQTMNQALYNLIVRNHITKDEGLSKSHDQSELVEMLQKSQGRRL